MTHARKQLPKYCHHKGTGRAFVRIEGKMYYLGEYGSAASRREYDRIIGEFVANGRQAFRDPDEILVEYLVARFIDHMEAECRYCDGTKKRLTMLLQLLDNLYGKSPVSHFTPTALKAIRRRFLDDGLGRDTINSYIGTIKQFFDWGCEEEIVPATVSGALRTVKALQKGRSSAIEYEAIQPVDDDIVEKTLKHIRSTQIRDMIRVQRLIGGRPQDVHNMRCCDIDRSHEIWKYTAFTHKTKHRGKIRELAIGPKAQLILSRYFAQSVDNPEQFVFSRSEARYFERRYGQTITTACKKAGVPPWTPNQLRHAAGTEIRERFGLDHAQASLGHSSARITETYAKVSFDKAVKVAKEIG